MIPRADLHKHLLFTSLGATTICGLIASLHWMLPQDVGMPGSLLGWGTLWISLFVTGKVLGVCVRRFELWVPEKHVHAVNHKDSCEEIAKVVVDETVIRGESQPILMYQSPEKVAAESH